VSGAAVVPSDRRHQPSSRLALIDASDELAKALRDCLSQPGLQLVAIAGSEPFASKKFEGFVVDLRNSNADQILETIRSSARNRRAVLFGVYADPSQVRRSSKYGINGLFLWPIRRADVLRVVRAAQTLLWHELRRYARIPLATEVELIVNQQTFHGVSREISGGGMSINFSKLPKAIKAEKAEVKFVVPPGRVVTLHGDVCWVYEDDNLLGVKFLPEPEPLVPVRAWIDDYLGIS